MEELNQNMPAAQAPENNLKTKRKVSHKKFLLWGLVITFLVAGTAGISFAQKVKQLRDKGPMFFMMKKFTDDLNLTDQQKTEVDKIREEVKAKMKDKKTTRESSKTDFENAFKQDKLDKETLKIIMQKRDAQREEMKDFMLDELIKFHDILTPEQRTKAVEKMQSMKDKKKKRSDRKDRNNGEVNPPNEK
jgi:protein CpxP